MIPYRWRPLLVLGLLLSGGAACAEEFSDYVRQQKLQSQALLEEYQGFQKTYQQDFELYKSAYEKAYNQYRRDTIRKWGEFKEADPEVWVSYEQGGSVRRTVDFKNGTVELEKIITRSESSSRAMNQLRGELIRLLRETEASAFHKDKVAQSVETAVQKRPSVMRGKPSDSLIMRPLIPGLKSQQQAKQVAKEIKKRIKADTRRAEIPSKNIVRLSFKLPVTANDQSRIYKDAVVKSAAKEEVPVSIVFAIMEAESNFNPTARSHIPAYGLMQIVPKSAGLDATRYLYGKPRLLSPSFLYNGENNIVIGSAYLHILFHNYLGGIKDPVSRLYCTIAAYNTGAGNVAKAFGRGTNIDRAINDINRMSPKQVYSRLLRSLPYSETRKYLRKVSLKLSKYQTSS